MQRTTAAARRTDKRLYQLALSLDWLASAWKHESWNRQNMRCSEGVCLNKAETATKDCLSECGAAVWIHFTKAGNAPQGRQCYICRYVWIWWLFAHNPASAHQMAQISWDIVYNVPIAVEWKDAKRNMFESTRRCLQWYSLCLATL